jgi:hypothetical protein
MTTWRVPEDLKTELSKLVPNPYPSLSAAVVALCRKGLQVPDPVGGFNPALAALREVESIGLLAMSTAEFQAEVKRKRLAALGIDPAAVEQAIAERLAARNAKDWARADSLRVQLDAQGIVVMDRPEGVEWRVRLESPSQNAYFYVPMMTDLTGSRWTTPKYTRPPGVPLCDLEIAGLRFDGGTRYDAPGNFGVMTRIFSLVVEGGSHNLVKEDTPVSWCKEGGNTEERYRDLSVEPGLWKWGETVVLTLSTQHLYPQDHFYLRVRIAGGAT